MDDLRLTAELQAVRRQYQDTYAPPPILAFGAAAESYGCGSALSVHAGLGADAGWRLFCHFSEPAHVFPTHTAAVIATAMATLLALLVQLMVNGRLGMRLDHAYHIENRKFVGYLMQKAPDFGIKLVDAEVARFLPLPRRSR